MTPMVAPTVAAGTGRVNAAALDATLASIVGKINALIAALGKARGSDDLLASNSLRWRMACQRMRDQIADMIERVAVIRAGFSPAATNQTIDGKVVSTDTTPRGRIFTAFPGETKKATFVVDGPSDVNYRIVMRVRTALDDTLTFGVDPVSQHPHTMESPELMQDSGPQVRILTDDLIAFLNIKRFTPSSIRVKTDNPGVSANNQFQLPLKAIGISFFKIEWGDGTEDIIRSYNDPKALHTYPAPGTYDIVVTGFCYSFRFDNGGDCLKVVNILAWGNSISTRTQPETYEWDVSGVATNFYGCSNLPAVLAATDTPEFWYRSSCINLFRGCGANFNQDLSSWDTQLCQDFSSVFRSLTGFHNGGAPLLWNTRNAKNMSFLCSLSPTFNVDITSWDTSKVIYLNGTFTQTGAFNQPIGTWNVENVLEMRRTFSFAMAFKQNIGAWWPRSCYDMTEFLLGSDINSPNSATSRANYDALLVGWTGWAAGAPGAKGLALQNNVLFHGGFSKYTAASDAAAARAWLIATKGWTILDGGAF
jgi:hypothetical protein